MTLHAVIMDGREYVMLPRRDWEAIAVRLREEDAPLPVPPAAADGMYGIAHVRIGLANEVSARRKAAALTQAQLARAAGVRPETICRLEAGKHMPSARTFERIERALRRAMPQPSARKAV